MKKASVRFGESEIGLTKPQEPVMSILIRQQLELLNRLYKEGHELYHEIATEMELSDSALMILYGLCHVGRPCTQKELSETWYLKKQTIHSALNNLIRSHNARMEPSPNNPRIKLIVLTEQGKALCKKTAIPFLEAELNAFGRLTPEERKTLLALTQKHSEFIQDESRKLLEGLFQ